MTQCVHSLGKSVTEETNYPLQAANRGEIVGEAMHRAPHDLGFTRSCFELVCLSNLSACIYSRPRARAAYRRVGA